MYSRPNKNPRAVPRYRPMVLPGNFRSARALGDADDLSEVQVTVQHVHDEDDDLSPVMVTARRVDEPMEEIIVSAKKIPWYAWALIGAVGVAFLIGGK